MTNSNSAILRQQGAISTQSRVRYRHCNRLTRQFHNWHTLYYEHAYLQHDNVHVDDPSGYRVHFFVATNGTLVPVPMPSHLDRLNGNHPSGIPPRRQINDIQYILVNMNKTIRQMVINSLWPSDAMWWRISGSILAQVMQTDTWTNVKKNARIKYGFRSFILNCLIIVCSTEYNFQLNNPSNVCSKRLNGRSFAWFVRMQSSLLIRWSG